MNLRAAGLLDDDRGNRHGPLELAQLDFHSLEADVFESLVAKLNGIDVRVVVIVMMFGFRVMVCQFGFALRSFWQPVRTRNPSDYTQRRYDRYGNQPITTTGCRLFDGIGHTANHSGDRELDLAVTWKRVKLVGRIAEVRRARVDVQVTRSDRVSNQQHANRKMEAAVGHEGDPHRSYPKKNRPRAV